jgi:hypothetical protein
MKTYKEEIRKAIDKIYCDCCGENCSKDIDHEYAELSATWGYGCKDDGMEYDIDLCEDCFAEVLYFIKDKKRKVLGPFDYPYDHDPLNGRRYFT